MSTFAHRVLSAAALAKGTYEEVEADAGATGQALVVVGLASVAGGIGLLGPGMQTARSLVAGIVGSLIGWMAWASLTYLIGTRLLPEPDTKADLGELLRTIALPPPRVFSACQGVIPFIGLTVCAIASIWMLLAMIVAVRQALDYSSTVRAVGVCIIGWACRSWLPRSSGSSSRQRCPDREKAPPPSVCRTFTRD